MKKIKFGLFMLICMSALVLRTEAKICNENDIEKLKNIANAVTISHEFIDSEEYGKIFSFEFFNLDREIKLVSQADKNLVVQGFVSETGEYVNYIKAMKPDLDKTAEIIFDVYATDNECYSKPLRTITLKTPRYNELSNTEICKKNPTQKGCEKLIDNDDKITKDELTKNIEAAKKEKAAKTRSIVLYVFIGLILLVAGGLATRYFITQKKMKDRGVI